MKNINKLFDKKKVISLDTYLDKALYDKNFGYYQKKDPFGIDGDFITAPNISNLFSEMIAIWIVSFWEKLNKPKNLNFVELGPGNADFCLNFVRTIKKFPKVYNSIKIHLYERSKILEKLQKKRLSNENIYWIRNIKKIKNGPIIFFGNEFLDALPIKQFKKKEKDIFEKFVRIKNNNIDFFYKKAEKKYIKKLSKFKLLKRDGIIEFPQCGFEELKIICEKIKKFNGGALFIDYGYEKNQNIDTLQSVKKHQFNDLKSNITSSDITYLVNFGLYKNYFKHNGLKVENIITQSKFLQKIGIIERFKVLSKNLKFQEKTNMYLRLKRLIHPEMMGQSFKVIFAKNKKCNFNLAFK